MLNNWVVICMLNAVEDRFIQIYFDFIVVFS